LFRKCGSLEAYITKQERSSQMSRTKALISILIVLILIALTGVSVWAAPGGDEPPVEPITEPTEEPTAEPTEEPTAEPTEEPPDEEPTVHPVASALANFFEGKLGLDYGTIMGYHEDGTGFGVIAQACWMASVLHESEAESNTTAGDMLAAILAAKKSGDFSSITLSEDGETPKNWGQFRKAVLKSEKAQKNLGAIMSGREKVDEDETGGDDTLGTTSTQGQGKGKKGKGPGEDGPPGKSKGGKKGGGPPAIPPGQEKDKGGRKGTGR
jgi:hypothetical protein